MNYMLIIGISLIAFGVLAFVAFLYFNKVAPEQSFDEMSNVDDSEEIVEIGLPRREDHLELKGNKMNEVLQRVTDMEESELVKKFRVAADLERDEYVDRTPVDPALAILMGHRLDKEEVLDSDDILLSDKNRAVLMRDYENTFYQRLLPFVNSISKSGRLICSSQVIEFLARNYDPIVLPGGQVTVLIVNEITPFVALALESNRPIFLKDSETGVTRLVEASELAEVTKVGSLADLLESNKELTDKADTLILENEGLRAEMHNVSSKLKVLENKALKWDDTVANLEVAESDMKALLEGAQKKVKALKEELKSALERPLIVENTVVKPQVEEVVDEEFRRAAESIPQSFPDASDDALTVAELQRPPEPVLEAPKAEPAEEKGVKPKAPSAPKAKEEHIKPKVPSTEPKKDAVKTEGKGRSRNHDRKPSGSQKREQKGERPPKCIGSAYVKYLSEQVEEYGADMEYLLKTHGIFAVRKSTATDEYMLFLENYRMGVSRKAWREMTGCVGEVRPFKSQDVMVFVNATKEGFASQVSSVKVQLGGFEEGTPLFDELYLKEELEEKLANEFDEKEAALTADLIAIFEEKKLDSIEIAVKEVLGE